jgi:hypothetical protein
MCDAQLALVLKRATLTAQTACDEVIIIIARR